jgi:vacuolar-type H+-ATPase subunit H
MKLIEEIKKAEEKGEKFKKNAAIEGQGLIQKTREKGEEELAALDAAKDKLIEKELTKAKKKIDAEVAKMDAQHEQNIKKIKDSYKKNKEKAVQKIQDLILKWPFSR